MNIYILIQKFSGREMKEIYLLYLQPHAVTQENLRETKKGTKQKQNTETETNKFQKLCVKSKGNGIQKMYWLFFRFLLIAKIHEKNSKVWWQQHISSASQYRCYVRIPAAPHKNFLTSFFGLLLTEYLYFKLCTGVGIDLICIQAYVNWIE